MSEDPTKDLTGQRTFEERVLSELGAIRRDIAALDSRLTALEERVDARLRETRPIWEAIQLSIEKLDEKFDNVIRDLLRGSRRRELARQAA